MTTMNSTGLSTGTPQAGTLRRHRFILAVASVSIAFFAIWMFRDTSKIDWNPFIRTPVEIAGHWRGHESVLALDPIGKYSCTGVRCSDLGSSGNWQRAGDFYIDFASEGGKTVEFRLAIKDGHLSLVTGASPGDPDMWNPEFTFTRDSK
jgi:hypothetical protein